MFFLETGRRGEGIASRSPLDFDIIARFSFRPDVTNVNAKMELSNFSPVLSDTELINQTHGSAGLTTILDSLSVRA